MRFRSASIKAGEMPPQPNAETGSQERRFRKGSIGKFSFAVNHVSEASRVLLFDPQLAEKFHFCRGRNAMTISVWKRSAEAIASFFQVSGNTLWGSVWDPVPQFPKPGAPRWESYQISIYCPGRWFWKVNRRPSPLWGEEKWEGDQSSTANPNCLKGNGTLRKNKHFLGIFPLRKGVNESGRNGTV